VRNPESSLNIGKKNEEEVLVYMGVVDAAWHRVPSHFMSRLRKIGMLSPTPVQQAVLPALMPRTPSEAALSDVPRAAIIQWPTGSGKTVAYAVQLLAGLDMKQCGVGTQGLIITPTRELCLQTLHMLQQLTDEGRPNKKGHGVKVMSLMGRMNAVMESELYHRPPDIAVGTPQMVARVFKDKMLPLAKQRSRVLVLDEVDMLMNDHFWPHMEDILGAHDRAPWKAGRLWALSANAPRHATQRFFQSAGIDEKPTELMSPEQMPENVRHVALHPPPGGWPYAELPSSIKQMLRAAYPAGVPYPRGIHKKNAPRALVFVDSAQRAATLLSLFSEVRR
jgi:superfamily II DNA/RNA helicase